MNLFPANPTHGMIFELGRGVLYQYDAVVNSWIKIASSNVILPLATVEADGAMTSADLQKLNRLMIPPPNSTIKGDKCPNPFIKGTIELYGDGKYIDINGNVDMMNIDSVGDQISESRPFHIHQHTYGFDFTLNIKNLVTELKKRGQFITMGPIGPTGEKGEEGDPGIDEILSGPQGDKGDQGLAPECALEVQPEPIQAAARRGLKEALTSVKPIIDPNDPKKYALQFDKQVVGKTNATTGLFNVKQQNSPWVLAVESIVSTPQRIYYIDIDIILDTIRAKYLSEVERLKKGYEDIVEFWIQTMSDLFDEQKAALCCALENCISKTKSDHLRRHMETVAAQALPNGILIHENGDGGGKIEVSSTGLWPEGYEEVCETPPKPINCGQKASYRGPGKYPRSIIVRLGPGAGTATLSYTVTSMAAKFIIKLKGKEIANTGYCGDPSKQSLLDSELAARGEQSETITGGRNGTIEFTQGANDEVTVDVYGPIDGTSWEFSISCTLPTVPCDQKITYSGGITFPWRKNVQLGSGTGTVTINYDTRSIPDRFIIYYDGNVVIDTGYRGDTSYQANLDGALAALSAPPATIAGPGVGSASFQKSTTSTVAMVEVYAPMTGTYWEFKMSCPPNFNNPNFQQFAQSLNNSFIEVDPLLNVSEANSARMNLDAGRYVAILRSFDVQINGKHYANLAISYISGNKKKIVKFLNKGKFDNLISAKSAYEGLTLLFDHDGGEIGGFFQMIPTANVSGSISIELEKIDQEPIRINQRTLNREQLVEYKKAWDHSDCYGIIVNAAGQDYIIIRGKSLSDSILAWPTINKKNFAPIPASNVDFVFNDALYDTVLESIYNRNYTNIKGLANHSEVIEQFCSTSILFPLNEN